MASIVHDIYGFAADDLEYCKGVVERILGIGLEEHYSSYRGKYYLHRTVDHGEYLLQPNFVEENDEGWTFDEHQDCGVLFFVSRLPDTDRVRQCLLSTLDDIKLLSRSIVTSEGTDAPLSAG
jgi:hypothetical protein